MVKIVFVADTHLGFDYPVKPKKVRRRRGPDFFKNFTSVLDYAIEKKADLVIHGGDLFFRTKVPKSIIDKVYHQIAEFAEKIPIIIVPGNHESSKLPDSVFLMHKNIYVLNKPRKFNFIFNGLRLAVCGFPCIRRDIKQAFPSIIEKFELSDNTCNILCVHQSIEGASVGPNNFTFKYGNDIIPVRFFPKNIQLVLAGHIHRQQQIKSKFENQKILYAGSIERTSFAEKDEAKGFYEINIMNSENIETKFIELPSRPMKDIILSEKTYSKMKLKESLLKELITLPSDSIVRIKFHNQENIRQLSTAFLDEVIPQSMNYQLSGINHFQSKINKTY